MSYELLENFTFGKDISLGKQLLSLPKVMEVMFGIVLSN